MILTVSIGRLYDYWLYVGNDYTSITVKSYVLIGVHISLVIIFGRRFNHAALDIALITRCPRCLSVLHDPTLCCAKTAPYAPITCRLCWVRGKHVAITLTTLATYGSKPLAGHFTRGNYTNA